jgi:hypothetical protein
MIRSMSSRLKISKLKPAGTFTFGLLGSPSWMMIRW